MFETVFWLETADAQLVDPHLQSLLVHLFQEHPLKSRNDVLVDGIAQRGFGVCLWRGDGDIVKGGSN